MTNIHHLQIPVVLTVTDSDYYPLPGDSELYLLDTTSIEEALRLLEEIAA